MRSGQGEFPNRGAEKFAARRNGNTGADFRHVVACLHPTMALSVSTLTSAAKPELDDIMQRSRRFSFQNAAVSVWNMLSHGLEICFLNSTFA
jgi:hypothetical protein